MRALLAILLLLGLAMAGCTSGNKDKDSDGTGTGTSTSTHTATGSSTTTSGTKPSSGSSSQTGTSHPANHPPVGSIGAAANGTVVRFDLAGSDQDGDGLNWTLSFGDGSAAQSGSTLPANATHTFVSGNYTAFYNLTDGKATSSYNVTLNITAAGGAPGLTFTGDVAGYCAFCTEVLGEQDGSEPASPFPSASWQSGQQGRDAVWVEVPAALAGHAWSASTTGSDIATAAFTACGSSGKFLEMVDTGANPETGKIPAGTGCFVLWEYLSWAPPPLGSPSDPTAGAQTLSLTIA